MQIFEKLKTILEFTKNIRTTGAVSETSEKVESEISSKVKSSEQQIIVEFGMGHGNITHRILQSMHPNSKLYSFEINKDFIKHVSTTIEDDRLKIINNSAENISSVLDENVDAIVSSIPLTFFSDEKTERILTAAYQQLKSDSYFSQILYSKKMKSQFEVFFDSSDYVKVPNFPTAYVHHNYKK